MLKCKEQRRSKANRASGQQEARRGRNYHPCLLLQLCPRTLLHFLFPSSAAASFFLSVMIRLFIASLLTISSVLTFSISSFPLLVSFLHSACHPLWPYMCVVSFFFVSFIPVSFLCPPPPSSFLFFCFAFSLLSLLSLVLSLFLHLSPRFFCCACSLSVLPPLLLFRACLIRHQVPPRRSDSSTPCGPSFAPASCSTCNDSASCAFRDENEYHNVANDTLMAVESRLAQSDTEAADGFDLELSGVCGACSFSSSFAFSFLFSFALPFLRPLLAVQSIRVCLCFSISLVFFHKRGI